MTEYVYCAVRAETVKQYNLSLQYQKDKQAKPGNLKLKTNKQDMLFRASGSTGLKSPCIWSLRGSAHVKQMLLVIKTMCGLLVFSVSARS